MVAVPFPGVAEAEAGAPGRVGARGVTVEEGELFEPDPAALVATTVNVYPVPFVSPETVQFSEPAVVHVLPSGVDVTV